ncbi:MAG TPA: MarR family transcriptional regulator [Actinomycetes bacterium]|nr:MarR family transcriptional regulator [Actinomycetes bacterium]
MPAPTLSPNTATGQDLVVALFGVARRLKARLPESQLEPALMFVLHQVQANGSLRVSELATCMGLDTSTASRHVRNLEDGGYLARTGDPGDRRASRVRVTPKGRGALTRAMRARAAMVDRAIAGWPDKDRASLATLMTRLADSLDRLHTDPETR